MATKNNKAEFSDTLKRDAEEIAEYGYNGVVDDVAGYTTLGGFSDAGKSIKQNFGTKTSDNYINDLVKWGITTAGTKPIMEGLTWGARKALGYNNNPVGIVLPTVAHIGRTGQAIGDIAFNTFLSMAKNKNAYDGNPENQYNIENLSSDILSNSGALLIDRAFENPKIKNYLLAKGASKLATEIGKNGLKFMLNELAINPEEQQKTEMAFEGLSEKDIEAALSRAEQKELVNKAIENIRLAELKKDNNKTLSFANTDRQQHTDHINQ